MSYVFVWGPGRRPMDHHVHHRSVVDTNFITSEDAQVPGKVSQKTSTWHTHALRKLVAATPPLRSHCNPLGHNQRRAGTIATIDTP